MIRKNLLPITMVLVFGCVLGFQLRAEAYTDIGSCISTYFSESSGCFNPVNGGCIDTASANLGDCIQTSQGDTCANARSAADACESVYESCMTAAQNPSEELECGGSWMTCRAETGVDNCE